MRLETRSLPCHEQHTSGADGGGTPDAKAPESYGLVPVVWVVRRRFERQTARQVARGKEKVVERRAINPWSWQDEEHFVQANEVRGMSRMLVVSGQASADAKTLHPGDMRAQIEQAMDNLQTVLEKAGSWPARKLLGVASLAYPDLLVEIEATAVA